MVSMTRLRPALAAAFAALIALAAAPTLAQLAKGAKAPLFSAPGAVAGKPVRVDLAAALKRGPVVLYFFPAAFTPGCNLEAETFARAIPQFQAAKATVIGMTAGNTDQLAAFSAQKCAGAFAVGAASAKIVGDYDVAMPSGKGWSGRTTYVIARDGRIAAVLTDLAPAQHVARSLAAVRALD